MSAIHLHIEHNTPRPIEQDQATLRKPPLSLVRRMALRRLRAGEHLIGGQVSLHVTQRATGGQGWRDQQDQRERAALLRQESAASIGLCIAGCIIIAIAVALFALEQAGYLEPQPIRQRAPVVSPMGPERV